MGFSLLRLRTRALILVGTAVASAAFLQCVGDDPTTVPTTDDAGSTDGSTPTDSSTDANTLTDSGSSDAGPSTCAWDKPFGTPVQLPGLPTDAVEGHPSLSADELTIYFHGFGGTLSDSATKGDIFTATRTSRTDPFGVATRVAISTNFSDNNASISHDGTTLYFDSSASDGGTLTSIFIAKRATTALPFTTAFALPSPPAGINTDDGQAFITADDVELWFTSRRDGGAGALDVYSAQNTGGSFGAAVPQTMLSSSIADYAPSLSFDRLTIYVSSGHFSGNNDILRSHRSTVTDGFAAPVPVTELNTTAAEFGGWMSPDNCRYYFETTRTGMSNVFMAERTP